MFIIKKYFRYFMSSVVELDLDKIVLELVPKAVDNLHKDPRLFRDKCRFWDYSVRQVREFLARLPAKYKGRLDEQLLKDSRAAVFSFPKSPYELVIGFKPSYQVILASEVVPKTPKDARVITIDPKDVITAPTFDLLFKPVDNEGTGVILRNALEQFYLKQGDIDDGTLIALGIKGKEVVLSDLELLSKFLSKITIQARCNYALGNGEATYKI